MGRLLAIAIWLITLTTVSLCVCGRWWFPESIAVHGPIFDHQFNLTFAIVAIVFTLVQIALGYFVWRYRGRERALYSHGDTRIEIICITVTAITFIALAIFGQRTWAQLQLGEAPPDAVEIEVTGQQFLWNFRYPGADGKFGATSPELYNDEDNSPTARPGPIGIDPRDAAGKDDLVSVGVLAVPIGKPIKLILRAKDVTHSFFVPELRLKQDAVPGLKINIHFTPIEEGRYEIVCAELCGLGHHRMRAFLEVKSEVDFKKWLQMKSQQ